MPCVALCSLPPRVDILVRGCKFCAVCQFPPPYLFSFDVFHYNNVKNLHGAERVRARVELSVEKCARWGLVHWRCGVCVFWGGLCVLGGELE